MNKKKKQYVPITVLQQVEVLLEFSVMSDVTPSFNVGGVDAYYQEREDHSTLDLDWD